MILNEDIYKYQFDALFNKVESLISRSSMAFPENDDSEEPPASNPLFDIRGVDFSIFKANETAYRHWVEIYIQKIIRDILDRKKIPYSSQYYGDGTEQNSITLDIAGVSTEAYFLFDIGYEEASGTDYDLIAKKLRDRNPHVAKINVYIFRDSISFFDSAYLINGSPERSENGAVTVFPLHSFFDDVFGTEEYEMFIKYASNFHDKCNSVISYKTVILPTNRTLSIFKQKKAEMLKEQNYRELADPSMLVGMKEQEYEKIKHQFIDKKMYMALVGNNDFAKSFISAEWAYDIYQNAMGELDLTGIIAGYLKSIEQLLYEIAQFHMDEGIEIKTKHNGYKEFTSTINDEHLIDITLGSLKDFLTKKKTNLAQDGFIRSSLAKSIQTWTTYQRNGYFHKHNLYKKDNKIGAVRAQTLYLYFLILGGFVFLDKDARKLGVFNQRAETTLSYNETETYSYFQSWMSEMFEYDLPRNIPGLWFLIIGDDDGEHWTISAHLMKHFSIDEFESGEITEYNSITTDHAYWIKDFCWQTDKQNEIAASFQVQDLVNKYFEARQDNAGRIKVILLSYGKISGQMAWQRQ